MGVFWEGYLFRHEHCLSVKQKKAGVCHCLTGWYNQLKLSLLSGPGLPHLLWHFSSWSFLLSSPPSLCCTSFSLLFYLPTLSTVSLDLQPHLRNSSPSLMLIIMSHAGIPNPYPLITEPVSGVRGTQPPAGSDEHEAARASASMPARKPFIIPVSFKHTHLGMLYGRSKRLFFPAGQHKKGGWAQSEEPVLEQKKMPHYHPSFSLSFPHHPYNHPPSPAC